MYRNMRTIIFRTAINTGLVLLLLISCLSICTDHIYADAPTVAKVKQVALGAYHSAAVNVNGYLFLWGSNKYGQLGCGDYKDKNSPVRVIAGTETTTFKAISLGMYHSAAIAKDGTLYTWGRNNYGQLGTGDNSDQPTPIIITAGGQSKFIAVSAGMFHTAAVTEDGKLYTWGRNNYGQLGNSSKTNSNKPVNITISGKSIKNVSSGAYHTAALCTDSSLYTWGLNNSGQLGNNNTEDSNKPIRIMSDKQFSSISMGGYHSAGISGGKLYIWGNNDNKQSSNNGKSFTYIALGQNFSAAINSGKYLHLWGSNQYGQLGNGDAGNNKEKTDCQIGKGYSSVALGNSHSAAIDTGGRLWMWGNNDYGQLGTGNKTSYKKPKEVIVPGYFDSVKLSKSQYTYTGTQRKPKTTVKCGTVKLVKNSDYTVTYKSNVKKGTAKVTVKGKGYYTGSKTVKFKIVARSIKSKSIKISGIKKGCKTTYPVNKKKKGPRVVIKYNGKKLKKGRDYSLSYKKADKIGKTYVLIKGKGNYKGEKKIKYKVVPKTPVIGKIKRGKGKKATIVVKKNRRPSGSTYVVQVCSNKGFKKHVGTRTLAGTRKSVKFTFGKGTKKGHRYYIRIRTRKKVNKKSYNSKWSKVVSYKL